MNKPLKQAKQAMQECGLKKRAWELLLVARQAITDPERWTKGEYARDQDGNALRTAPQRGVSCSDPRDEIAFREVKCFCGMGVLLFNANAHADFNAAWPILVQAVLEFKGGSARRNEEAADSWKKVKAGDADAQAVFHDFNDHADTTHAEVLAVYDAAIVMAAKDYVDSLPY